MSNHLRMCIVGGRSFGKTALVKAVSQIPCFIACSNKGTALKLQNSAIDGNDWSQTKWEDVLDWKFKFTIEDGDKKDDGKKIDKTLSFVDYPGEYFEREYEDATCHDAASEKDTAAGDNKSATWMRILSWCAKFWPWSEHRCPLLYNPDGVIILLPRDFGAKDKEKGNDVYKRNIYESRVLEYLDKIRPGTPVQIVISKWDLKEGDEEVDKIDNPQEIVELPAFKSCYERILNGYRSRNGKEYDAEIMAISTNDLRDGKWIKPEEPNYTEGYNVRKLFKEMAIKSDEARTIRLKNDWDNAIGWKRWKRMFVLPWRSLDVRLKNSTDQDVNTIFWKSWKLFGSFILATVVAACAVVVTTASVGECIRLSGIKREIASGEKDLSKVTRDKLKNLDERIRTSNWVQPLFFMPSLGTIKKKQDDLKVKYIQFLEEDLTAKLNDSRVVEMSPWDVNPDERMKRAEARLDIVTNQMVHLPYGMSSDAMRRSEEGTRKFIEQLAEDREFDKELYAINDKIDKQKLRAINALISQFRSMSESRNGDYNRLVQVRDNLEVDLSCALTNKLAEVDNMNLGGDAGDRFELKISIISNELDTVFIPEREVTKQWERKLSEIKKEKALDSHYGPFDRAYAGVNTNDLKAISVFCDQWPGAEYPLRQSTYESLAQSERRLLEAINEAVVKCEDNFSDDEEKSMSFRIDQAKRRIEEYENAIKKLRSTDGLYKELCEKDAQTKTWIEDHKKYMDFENDWKDVAAVPKNEKVPRIVAFFGTHDKDDFPEYSNRLDTAQKQAEEISADFMRDCTNEIAKLRNEQIAGFWKTQVTSAEDRIRLIDSVLPSVLESDKPTLNALIQIEKDHISAIKRKGEFSDALMSVTNAPDDRVLLAIVDFKNQFLIADYPERAVDFDYLNQREVDELSKISNRVERAIEEIPIVRSSDFSGLLKRSQKIYQVYESALESIPTNYQAYASYQRKRNGANNDADKYAKWVQMHDDKVRLERDAEENNDEISISEMLIKKSVGFLDKYPEKDHPDGELQEIYKVVEDILDKAEKRVFNAYKVEDQNYSQTSDMGEEEKINVIKARMELCDKYMEKFSANSDFFRALVSTKDDLGRKLSERERERRYAEEYNGTKTIANDNEKPITDRIAAIDMFLGQYDKPEYTKKREVERAVEEMSGLKARLVFQKSFDDDCAEMKNNLKQRPEGEDAESLKKYKRQCLSYEEKFKQKKGKSPILDSRIQSILVELRENIKWVDGQLGDGSFADISKMETAYKKKASRENYNALMDAIDAFDETKDGNTVYKGKKDQIKAAAEQDWKLANAVKENKTKFLKVYDQDSYNKLVASLRAFCANSYREKDGFKKSCENFLDTADALQKGNRKLSFGWKLKEFDFENTDYARRTDQSIQVTLTAGGQIFDNKMSDIQKNRWWFGAYKKGKDPEGEIEGIGINGSIKIVIKHRVFAHRSDNELSITAREILALGIKGNGTAEKVFILNRKSGYKVYPKDATMTFEFSGLPSFPDTDEE